MPVIKALQKHKVVFDTHVFLWYMEENPKLSTKFLNSIERLHKFSPVLISPLTLWEISLLAERGRIVLEMDCLDWIEKALLWPGCQLAPITPQIAVLSNRLPGNIHKDPVDRMLIATSFENKAVLVTCDEAILEYGKNHFISVCDPRK